MSILIDNQTCRIIIEGETCETSHRSNLYPFQMDTLTSESPSSEDGDLELVTSSSSSSLFDNLDDSDDGDCGLITAATQDEALEPSTSTSSSVSSTTSHHDYHYSGHQSGCYKVDSGIECVVDDFTLPDADLMNRIVGQVEHYFSDENLIKDAFLLKHIRRNRDGFVSLKLVSSFRKMKAICKNWTVVAYSVKNGSKKLEVNESFTKVRRTDPLPESLRPLTTSGQQSSTPVSPFKSNCKSSQQQQPMKGCRTILAYNFPFKRITIENVSKFFSAYGEVASVRVIRRESGSLTTLSKTIEDILSKRLKDHHIDEDCAVVEFDDQKSVDKAVEHLGAQGEHNWRNNLKVIKLEETNGKVSSQRSPSRAFQMMCTETGQTDQLGSSSGTDSKSDRRPSKKRNKREKTNNLRFLATGDVSDSFSGSCSENEHFGGRSRYNSGGSGSGSGRWLSSRSNRGSVSSGQLSHSNSRSHLPPPFVRQKSKSCSTSVPMSTDEALKTSAPSRSCNASPLHLPQNVIRLPKGPDGSRGFQSTQRSRSQSAPFPIAVKAF